MDQRILVNRRAWDEKTEIHIRDASSYHVQDFKAGKSGWTPNVPDPLGPVAGKSLLHLQCHFGMDTLMWARQGAQVTGVDFSPVAVAEARKLAEEVHLPATFVEADIAELPRALAGEFDIVLTYYGTITWLPDLAAWGRTIAHFLKPGGFFYLADTHPVAMLYEAVPGEPQPKLLYRYFTSGQPERCEAETGTYADPTAAIKNKVTYQWQHTLQDILGALIAAGLKIEYLHEFPYSFYNRFCCADIPGGEQLPPIMLQGADSWWRMREGDGQLPLMFSVKAVRPM